MQKLINFYAILFAPLLILFLVSRLDLISPGVFAVSLLLYALFYHPVCSYLRLKATNKLGTNSLWKFFVPFWSLQFFEEIYFTR